MTTGQINAKARGGTAVFSIIAKNYLAHARVLMQSVEEHHPDWARVVVIVDEIDGYFDPARENFDILESEDLAIPNSRWFHFKYSVLELCTAIKPFVFEKLFREYGFERILYLDPDIALFSTLDRVAEALDTAVIVLTPHLTGPLTDRRKPAEIDILRSGAYNLGFLALARSAASDAFLAWWREKLYDYCVVDLPGGIFVDQKWVDLVPGMFEGVAIIRDPGYNVAYWNLAHRSIVSAQSGYEVDGKPLAFFHFSGYDAEIPERLSKHQNRYRAEDLSAAVRELLDSYGADLQDAGLAACRKWPYTYSSFDNGIRIPDLGRAVHLEAPALLESVEDPFSEEGFRAFRDLWNAPLRDDLGARPGISRLAYQIYRARTDVQSAMPDISGTQYRRFLEWMVLSAPAEHGIDDVFLSPVVEALRTYRDPVPDALPRNGFSNEFTDARPGSPRGERRMRLTHLVLTIYESRRDLQERFPDPTGGDSAEFLTWLLTYGRRERNLSVQNLVPMRRQWPAVMGLGTSLGTRLKFSSLLRAMGVAASLKAIQSRWPLVMARYSPFQNYERDARVEQPAPRAIRYTAPTQEFGMNLVGYFYADTGMGQAARSTYQSLCASDIPVSLCAADEAGNRQNFSASLSPDYPYRVNLFQVNADQAEVVRRSLGEEFYRDRRNIGYWAWELDEFPDRWAGAFTQYQEIWTLSNFSRNAIAAKSPVGVHAVPLAVAPVVPQGMDRSHFGLARDRFIFLCAFDTRSVPERKNPLGVVRAFQMAFQGNPRFELVLKVNHSRQQTEYLTSLQSSCPANVRIFDSSMSREEMYALTQCSDCVVSLHRSEGFGLLLAEAMYLGKPVIATNYSGNTDFTKPDNSLLVNYKLTPVGRNCAPYDPAGVWADPDVEQAANYMMSLASSAELRTRLANAGRLYVRTHLSPDAVGGLIRARLAHAGPFEGKSMAGSPAMSRKAAG